MQKKVTLKISGRVQGVFFRVSAQDKARELNLAGWVKNEANSTVTIEAAGEENKLQELIKWCQEGPECAKVDNVEVNWYPAGKKFSSFIIKH